jgi:hypothetical protein
MPLGRVALVSGASSMAAAQPRCRAIRFSLSVRGAIYTIRFVCGLAGACPADANIPPENQIKMMPKLCFPVKNQLFKICVFRIAAAHHYCFSSQRTSLFCW